MVDWEMRMRIMHSLLDLLAVFSFAFSLFWAWNYWVETRAAQAQIERLQADLRVADRFIVMCLNQRTFVYGGQKGVGIKCFTM